MGMALALLGEQSRKTLAPEKRRFEIPKARAPVARDLPVCIPLPQGTCQRERLRLPRGRLTASSMTFRQPFTFMPELPGLPEPGLKWPSLTGNTISCHYLGSLITHSTNSPVRGHSGAVGKGACFPFQVPFPFAQFSIAFPPVSFHWGAEIMRRPLKTTPAGRPNPLPDRLKKRPGTDRLLCTAERLFTGHLVTVFSVFDD
jgi:hypothetical protein